MEFGRLLNSNERKQRKCWKCGNMPKYEVPLRTPGLDALIYMCNTCYLKLIAEREKIEKERP